MIGAALEDIAGASELVYHQGEGAKTRIFVTVPNDVDTIEIENSTVKVTLMNGEVIFRNLDFNISGNITTEEGNLWVFVESQDDHVSIDMGEV